MFYYKKKKSKFLILYVYKLILMNKKSKFQMYFIQINLFNLAAIKVCSKIKIFFNKKKYTDSSNLLYFHFNLEVNQVAFNA